MVLVVGVIGLSRFGVVVMSDFLEFLNDLLWEDSLNHLIGGHFFHRPLLREPPLSSLARFCHA